MKHIGRGLLLMLIMAAIIALCKYCVGPIFVASVEAFAELLRVDYMESAAILLICITCLIGGITSSIKHEKDKSDNKEKP